MDWESTQADPSLCVPHMVDVVKQLVSRRGSKISNHTGQFCFPVHMDVYTKQKDGYNKNSGGFRRDVRSKKFSGSLT